MREVHWRQSNAFSSPRSATLNSVGCRRRIDLSYEQIAASSKARALARRLADLQHSLRNAGGAHLGRCDRALLPAEMLYDAVADGSDLLIGISAGE